jgi:DNA polymerase-1
MALVGDSADNIPGVKGIGPKTALSLMLQYGSLEEILRNSGSIKGRSGELLTQGREMALLSRDLVTIRCNVEFEFDPEQARFRGIDAAVAGQYFTAMGMSSIAASFTKGEAEPVEVQAKSTRSVKKQYCTVTTLAQARDMISEITAAGSVAVDTETTSLKALEAALVGMSFSTAPGKAWYIPLMNEGLFPELPAEGDRNDLLALIKPVLEDPAIRKTGQNIKYDMLVLHHAGIELRGVDFDTMLASYVIDPARRHNMDDLAADYLGYRTITYDELVGTGRKRWLLRCAP